MPLNTRRRQVGREATRLKKAWLFASACLGLKLKASDRFIPAYDEKPHELRSHIRDLRLDVETVLALLFRDPKLATHRGVIPWMSDQFDAWQAEGGGLKLLGSASDVEKRFGELRIRESIEVPPYAELLLQAWHGLAVRHPEYHLARDVELLRRLFQDAEELVHHAEIGTALNRYQMPSWAPSASENIQTLGRAVILSCFNLIEAFVSGLAREAVMTRTELSEELKEKLLNNNKTLRWRVLRIPELLTGRPSPLRDDSEPLLTLFGKLKAQRDAFVHCEPGTQATARGHIKEELFHNVDARVVELAHVRTKELIRILWLHVHARAGPRWLAGDEGSRQHEHDLRLRPPETDSHARHKI